MSEMLSSFKPTTAFVWNNHFSKLVSAIRVQVHARAIADWIRLQKPANVWIIVPGAVVVKTCFKIECPAGEHVGIGKEVGV